MATDYSGGDRSLLFFTSDSRSLGHLAKEPAGYPAPPRWLPDDLGLVSATGNDVQWIRQRDGEWVSEAMPALEDLSPEVVLLIEW